VIGMKQRRPAGVESVRVVRYTCPRCGRWLEEVEGRRMMCILCRVRMVDERRRRDGQE
jgi:DNA-directed RNA polymerase subunit RPC12/RpoP